MRQEYSEIERQWTARNDIAHEADRHKRLNAEKRYFESIFGRDDLVPEKLIEKAVLFVESHESPNLTLDEHSVELLAIDNGIIEAKQAFLESIKRSVSDFYERTDRVTKQNDEWVKITDEIDQADDAFAKACHQKGLVSDDFERLAEINQSMIRKSDEISQIESKIRELEEGDTDPDESIKKVVKIWMDQYQTRLDAVNDANRQSILNDGKRFIEVHLKYQADKKSFQQLWQDFCPLDGRTRLSRAWEAIGNEVFDTFCRSEADGSPWEVLMNRLLGNSDVSSNIDEYRAELIDHIDNNQDRWMKLRRSRVGDGANLLLFRSDGSLAGSVAEGSLSDGQRNTAALALLLAHNDGPLIIDQPEDELDSNFVFNHLIPMIRNVKHSRQIIVATHHANLPVNGDAEAIFAFDTKSGRGLVKTEGGMDRKEVTRVILDVMEGTEEAFRKRREKYYY